jgi:hypothetical protein
LLFTAGVKGAESHGRQHTRTDHFIHPCGKILFAALLLAKVANFGSLYSLIEKYPPLHGNYEAKHPFEKGCLAGAVFADYAEIISPANRAGKITDYTMPAITERGVLTGDNAVRVHLLQSLP